MTRFLVQSRVLVIKGFIKRPLDVPVYEVVPLQQTLKINYGID